MTHYKIFYEKMPSAKEASKLTQGLTRYADVMKGHTPIQEFAFFIRNGIYRTKGQVRGGCHGWMYYGCLHVDQLWIEPVLRHQGYGKQLMQAAEQLGQQKNCLFATVNTMDWEALNFYKKLGYYIEFERSGYLKDSICYFLRKSLFISPS